MTVRPYRADDRPAVEAICVESGLRGNLGHFFKDSTLFAKLWLAPFLDAEPESTWVAEIDGRVVGYLVAAIRPGFKSRALRAMLPHLWTLIRRFAQGDYRSHAPSGRFVRWMLTRSWRETPNHPHSLSNFHFNVSKSERGATRIGNALTNTYFAELRRRGIPRFQIHVFGSASKRNLNFYRKLTFKVLDARVCSLFSEPTVVAALEAEVPKQDLVNSRDGRAKNLERISVVLPVHNEADVLSGILHDLKQQALPADEIIVVCDQCTDDSEAIARKAGARVVTGVYGHCGPSRNAGLLVATGDIVVVLDADTRVQADFLALVLASVEAGYDCGGPRLVADEKSWLSRLWVGGQNFVRKLTGCSYGTAYFATRAHFERAGAYDTSLRWAEDVELSLRHRLRGRARRMRTTVVYSCRRLRENGRPRELWRRLLRALKSTPGVVSRLREHHSRPTVERSV